jgi:hypothetical protein
MLSDESEAGGAATGTAAPVSRLKRLLALLALAALLTSGAVTSCWILTDRVEFRGATPPQATQPLEAP